MDKAPAEQLSDIRRRYGEGDIQPSDDMEFLLDLVGKLQEAVMNLAISLNGAERKVAYLSKSVMLLQESPR